MTNVNRVPRAEKLVIATSILSRLNERKDQGPAEPGLDAFIAEIEELAPSLGTHVTGKAQADAARIALLEVLDVKDDDVDTWMRHIHGYLDAEGLRRTGPFAAVARALCDAAFPSGLDPINHHVIDENAYCRDAVSALRSPEHQETITGVGMPATWIDSFDAAIKESDTTMDALTKARGDKGAHIGMGLSAEIDWCDLMTRLRRHVAGRAKKSDIAKQIEGQRLLEPLTTALKKIAAEDAARATRRSKAAPQAEAPAAPPVTDTPGSTANPA